ncbi:MAG: ribonuclease HI family protein [Nitrospirota bacterium]|jgi:ribonuclease HI
MKRASIHSDGASLGNPGPAGIGVVVEYGGKRREISEHIGTATNNVAEYSALLRGLEEARRMGAEEVSAFLDSELTVKQLRGEYKVRNEGLRPLYERTRALLGSFKRSTLRHIPREENKEADRLSKQAARATARSGRATARGDSNLEAGVAQRKRAKESEAQEKSVPSGDSEDAPGEASSSSQGRLPF